MLELAILLMVALEVTGETCCVLGIIFSVVAELQLIIYTLQFTCLFRRVDLLHVDELDAVRRHSSVGHEEHLVLGLRQSMTQNAVEDGLEFVVFDAVVVVVSRGILTQLLFEQVPFSFADLVVDLLIESLDLLHVHLDVDRAEVTGADGFLPAERMLAALTMTSSVARQRVLPEVGSFTWVDLVTHCQVEVLVRDLAIPINVKVVVDLLKLHLRHLEAPVIEIELELRRRNTLCRYVLVHVLEGFQDTRPLLSNFQDDVLAQFSGRQLPLGPLRVLTSLLLTLKIPLILRVAHRIVPKEEAF